MPILSSLPLKPFPSFDNDEIFVVGYKSQLPSSNDGILQKFNPAGTSEFILTFNDRLNGVAVHKNGDYVITSSTNVGTTYFRKYGSDNILDWSLSASNIDAVRCKFDYYGRIYLTYRDTNTGKYSCRRYSNGGVLELTISNVSGGALAVDKYYNIYTGGSSALRKYNSSGTFLWELTFPGDFGDGIINITTDTNENVYFVVGASAVNDTFKYDKDGNLIWSRNHGNGDVTDIHVDSNANVYTTGDLISTVTTRKYNSAGTLQWSTGNLWGGGTSIKVSNDNFVYISQGTTETDIQLRKLNASNGSLVWSRKLNTSGVWGANDLDIQYKDFEI